MDKDRELKKKIKASFQRKALSKEDIQARINWINTNVSPMARRIESLNSEMARWWRAFETWTPPLDDALFVRDILSPLRDLYSNGILSLEQLEQNTQRGRRL